MSVRQQLCTFFLDDLYFGVEVQKVQEVIRYQEMTRVPLAQPVVRGLINLRGQIVTAIDMRRRLGLPALSADRLPMNVVIRTDDGPVYWSMKLATCWKWMRTRTTRRQKHCEARHAI
jgi:purine-binding chemotaxis protein CheW